MKRILFIAFAFVACITQFVSGQVYSRNLAETDTIVARTDFSVNGINYYIHPLYPTEVCVMGSDSIIVMGLAARYEWYSPDKFPEEYKYATCQNNYPDDRCFYSEEFYEHEFYPTGTDHSNPVWEGNCYAGDVIIPPTVEYNETTYTVKAIMPGAFCHCHELTSISLPSTIVDIGTAAFFDCPKLTELDFGHLDAFHVGEDIVGECTNLRVLKLPRHADPDKYWPTGNCRNRVQTTDHSSYQFVFLADIKNLTEIYNPNSEPYWTNAALMNSLSDRNDRPLYIPIGATENYAQEPTYWSEPFFWNDQWTFVEHNFTGASNYIVDYSDVKPALYDLQGRKVLNPSPGIYIERSGNTTSKVLVK